MKLRRQTLVDGKLLLARVEDTHGHRPGYVEKRADVQENRSEDEERVSRWWREEIKSNVFCTYVLLGGRRMNEM